MIQDEGLNLEVSFQSKDNKVEADDVFQLVERTQDNGILQLFVKMTPEVIERSITPPSINNVLKSPQVELVGEWIEIKPTYDERLVPFEEWHEQDGYYVIQLKLPPVLAECKKWAYITDVGWCISFIHPELICEECDSLPCICPEA